MSSHSEKLLELELELRSLRGLRDEVENLRGTMESVRTRLNTLEQGGRSGTGSTHTLGQSARAENSASWRLFVGQQLTVELLCFRQHPWKLR